VDQLTWKDYEADLGRNLEDLHDRVQRGAYRALPSRRVYIPKPDGRQRPLAVAALEDKIVQRAVVTLLNAIYEEDFLGFSCGFRPGRGTHDALDALCVGIGRKKVSFILDADIRSFARRQLGKPETFQFLGFTFICGQSRRGRFLLKRKSRGDRMRAKLME
jgi:retron-type reverse transcriptase